MKIKIRVKDIEIEHRCWFYKTDGEKRLTLIGIKIKMNKKQIIKLIEEWWEDEKCCSGKPHCCIKDCDLCINCLNDLLKKFGGKWENGKFLLLE